MKFTTFLVSALLLNGCFGGKEIKHSFQKVPSWYTTPLISNEDFFYGVGSGDSEEDAKSSALSRIASEISISVSSTFKSNTKYDSDIGLSKRVEQNIKTLVDGVTFHGASVEKKESVGNTYYAFVKVDKRKFIEIHKNNFLKKDVQIDSLFDFVKSKEKYQALFNLKILEEKIFQAQPDVYFLGTLSNSFNRKFYIEKYNFMLEEVRSLVSKVTIFVDDDSLTESYSSEIKKYLTQLGVQISREQSTKLHLKLDISHEKLDMKSTSLKLQNAHFSNVVLNSKLKYSGKLVGENSTKMMNVSKINYSDAIRKTDKFVKLVEREGIVKVLTGK
jgi:hypothetical protein